MIVQQNPWILEQVAGENRDHSLIAANDPALYELPRSRQARGTGRLAADTGRVDHRFRLEDFPIFDGGDHAICLPNRFDPPVP